MLLIEKSLVYLLKTYFRILDRFSVQRLLSKCLKGFIVSEVNSEAEQVRGQSVKRLRIFVK